MVVAERRVCLGYGSLERSKLHPRLDSEICKAANDRVGGAQKSSTASRTLPKHLLLHITRPHTAPTRTHSVIMKLDTRSLRYLTAEDWRVLTAVEMGSRNHELVPTPLIVQISGLRAGSGVHKSISTLAKADLIARMKNASCLFRAHHVLCDDLLTLPR